MNCQGLEIDVMDFIKCELHWAVHEKLNPIYAPYVMKLILDKVPYLNQDHFTIHKTGTLQVLKHDKPFSSNRVPFASSDEEKASEAPMPTKRSKNANPPHGWLARARRKCKER